MIRYRGAAVSALAAVTVLLAGCASTIQGSPTIDPVAASALAAASATSPSTASPTPRTTAPPPGSSSPNPFPTDSPIPPVAPSTSSPRSTAPGSSAIDTQPPPDSGPVETPTSHPSAGPSTVLGVPVGDIVHQLAADPVAADAAARSSAGASAMSSLEKKVTDARDHGLDIWVVLIGHEVKGDLTDVSDAVAHGVGGTAVVVTTSEFAVSSKLFSHTQLQKAEDVAASASSPAEAASILVDQFRAAAASMSTSSGPTGGAGGVVSLPSFQLANHSIGCMISDDTVRCDLQVKPTFTPPKNPHPTCNGVYGRSISLSKTGKPEFTCISDTVYDPHAPILKDGGETAVGDVMCFANGPEVSCFNLTSAHGFYLSPSTFGVF